MFVLQPFCNNAQKEEDKEMDSNLRRQLEENGADVETTLKRFVGNDAIYIKFLKKFPDDPNYGKLGESMEKEDFEEAYKCAHALKGVVGNLGLTPIFEKVSNLVEELRGKKSEEVNADSANAEWQEVKTAYETFIGIIRENL